MRVKQLTTQIDNRPGVLSELASALWERGVNILAFKGEVYNGKATIHLRVDKSAAAREVFADHAWNAAKEMIARAKSPKISKFSGSSKSLSARRAYRSRTG